MDPEAQFAEDVQVIDAGEATANNDSVVRLWDMDQGKEHARYRV